MKKEKVNFNNPEGTSHTYGKSSDWYGFDMDSYPGRDYWEKMAEMESMGKEYDRIIANALKKKPKFTKTLTPAVEYDKWLTTQEVTTNYPVCENTLRKLRNNKEIPSTLFNRRYLYKKEDVDAYFHKNYNGKKKQGLDEAA